MTISIWRYSHMALAISAAAFILMLSVTGAILAFDPIDAKLESNISVDEFPEQTLGSTLAIIKEKYGEVVDLKKDRNGFLLLSTIDETGELQEFFIHPITGEKTGEKREKSELIKFMTNLHRSLFLKSIGRFFIGLSSFLFLLIAITGFILLIKRQQGLKNIFKKVIKENFSQFGHVALGRLAFVPILIVAATGVYLSLLRFSIIPDPSLEHDPDFDLVSDEPAVDIFNEGLLASTYLKELRSIEFPFSEDVYDFYTISLTEKEIQLNQYTGEVLSELSYPIVNFYSEWMTVLHTGEGSIGWSIVLLLVALTVPFFVYSGFRMTVMRRANRLKSEYSAEESEYIILVGSETGTTMGFANLFYKKLLSTGAKAFIGQMNEFRNYPSLKQLVIFTATYGEGEAPANAEKFQEKLEQADFNQTFGYSVIGFGSMAYPEFCKYAFDVDEMLEGVSKANREKAISTVNNRSWDSFKQWAQEWGARFNLNLALPEKYDLEVAESERHKFEIVSKRSHGDSFLLKIKPDLTLSIESGDLLAIPPTDGSHDRLYSIGKFISGNLLIAVKKYENGVCSNFLDSLGRGEVFDASLIQNKSFYLPRASKDVIMISTGTGIAPFLGMIATSTRDQSIDLYWGGKTEEAYYELYEPEVENLKARGLIHSPKLAFSREQGKERTYVQDLLSEDAKKVSDLLNRGGVVMICGSLKMRDGVLELLQSICHNSLNMS
ncbi:MAG: PepSY domain-containing protein, partial [Bacteroidota bacterium]